MQSRSRWPELNLHHGHRHFQSLMTAEIHRLLLQCLQPSISNLRRLRSGNRQDLISHEGLMKAPSLCRSRGGPRWVAQLGRKPEPSRVSGECAHGFRQNAFVVCCRDLCFSVLVPHNATRAHRFGPSRQLRNSLLSFIPSHILQHQVLIRLPSPL